MDFIIKRSGKDEKSVAWSFFSFSSCFIDLIPNFVSNIGFRISRWRETELKGNPVQIRNYPRSCKFHLPINIGEKIVAFFSHWSCKDREGATTETSQKTCHAPFYHCFRGKSVESNEPDKSSIISFITLIQRKCVKTDKLCQVYLCVSGRRDFARTLLNSNRLKKE